MKRTKQTKQKLLITTDKVRELVQPELDLRGVIGGYSVKFMNCIAGMSRN